MHGDRRPFHPAGVIDQQDCQENQGRGDESGGHADEVEVYVHDLCVEGGESEQHRSGYQADPVDGNADALLLGQEPPGQNGSHHGEGGEDDESGPPVERVGEEVSEGGTEQRPDGEGGGHELAALAPLRALVVLADGGEGKGEDESRTGTLEQPERHQHLDGDGDHAQQRAEDVQEGGESQYRPASVLVYQLPSDGDHGNLGDDVGGNDLRDIVRYGKVGYGPGLTEPHEHPARGSREQAHRQAPHGHRTADLLGRHALHIRRLLMRTNRIEAAASPAIASPR